MSSLVQRFLKDESGATAVEYGLIAAGISLAIITVAHSLATHTFSHVPDELAKTSAGRGS
ncbi:MAG: Flp family type IVb pilin [Rhodoplanes sp.]